MTNENKYQGPFIPITCKCVTAEGIWAPCPLHKHAPELLEIAEEGLAFIIQVSDDLPYGVSPQIAQRFQKAIAKAKGQPND